MIRYVEILGAMYPVKMTMSVNVKHAAKYGRMYPPLTIPKSDSKEDLLAYYEHESKTLEERLEFYYMMLNAGCKQEKIISPFEDLDEFVDYCEDHIIIFKTFQEMISESRIKSTHTAANMVKMLDQEKKKSTMK